MVTLLWISARNKKIDGITRGIALMFELFDRIFTVSGAPAARDSTATQFLGPGDSYFEEITMVREVLKVATSTGTKNQSCTA